MRNSAGDDQLPVFGLARYLADLEFDPAPLEVAVVRSPLPNAAILSVRLPEGSAESGAIGGADLCSPLLPIAMPGPGLKLSIQLPVAVERVRFVGEPVALTWAADRYLAEDIAEEVEIDYDPLPDDMPLHDAAPDDVLFESSFRAGPLEECFDAAAHIFEDSFHTSRQTPAPLEGRGVVARPLPDGGLELWTSTQVPDIVRQALSHALQIPLVRIQILVPRVGGGFGLKAHVFGEEIALAALALRLRRPLRWLEDRRENLMASAHAHEEVVSLKVAVSEQGRVTAVEAEVEADVGAYSIYPFSASLEPLTTAGTLFGPYDLQAFAFRARGRASHRCPAGAYRGVGMNAAAHATERMMDEIAAGLRLDPLQVRRRNLIRELPALTMAGRSLDSGDYAALLDKVAGRYGGLRDMQSRARAQGRLVGVGVGLFNEHSGTGAREYRRRGVTAVPGLDATTVRVTESGRIQICTSAADAGQRHAETYRGLAVRELGVLPEMVEVIEGDTRHCPPGSGTFASRTAVGVLESVVRALRAAAAEDLRPGLEVTRVVNQSQVFPAGAHVAAVEVDPVSFVPRVLSYFAVEDCGTVVNPHAVEAQICGGVAMGIGNVLLEEHVYSADGQILTASLLDYLLPVATDVPPIEIQHLESASPLTILGSKGVAEAGTIGAFAAVANAVADAVAPLGAQLRTLPLSPSRVAEAVLEPAGRPPS